MRAVLACLVAALAALPLCAAAETCPSGLMPTARTELFFGVSGPRTAWARFLRDVVTPRFPEGLTVIEGQGQWHAPSGPQRERVRVLVIFYRRDRDSDARIEAIRSIYKSRFRQASVLRADTTACAGF